MFWEACILPPQHATSSTGHLYSQSSHEGEKSAKFRKQNVDYATKHGVCSPKKKIGF